MKLTVALCLLIAGAAVAEPPVEPSPIADVEAPPAPTTLAPLLAGVIRDALPREYAKQEDWGTQKRITSGLKFDGLRVSRRKKEVNHGTWKQYRVLVDESVAPLHVSIENLRSLDTGAIGLTLVVRGQLKGWAQMRRFNRGVHLLTISAEGHSHLTATIDCEIRLAPTPTGIAVQPIIRSARVDIHDFELTKFGEIRGKLAHELGNGMKRIIERELNEDKLTAKLNRAIEKKRDRLKIDFAAAASLREAIDEDAPPSP